MSKNEVDGLLNQRSAALAMHELDRVFGEGNVLTRHFITNGEIPMNMLARALLRQQYHNIVRLERIEDKLGIKWDPLSLDAKPNG